MMNVRDVTLTHTGIPARRNAPPWSHSTPMTPVSTTPSSASNSTSTSSASRRSPVRRPRASTTSCLLRVRRENGRPSFTKRVVDWMTTVTLRSWAMRMNCLSEMTMITPRTTVPAGSAMRGAGRLPSTLIFNASTRPSLRRRPLISTSSPTCRSRRPAAGSRSLSSSSSSNLTSVALWTTTTQVRPFSPRTITNPPCGSTAEMTPSTSIFPCLSLSSAHAGVTASRAAATRIANHLIEASSGPYGILRPAAVETRAGPVTAYAIPTEKVPRV